MLREVVDIFIEKSSRRNEILVDAKRKTSDSLLHRLNMLPHKVQKLSLREAGWVERSQNLLLCLLILSLNVFGDQL